MADVNEKTLPEDYEIEGKDTDVTPEDFFKGKGDKSVPREPRVNEDDSEGDEGKLLAGKYNSIEELEKGYNELYKQFTKARQGISPDSEEKASDDDTDTDMDIDPDKKVDDLEIDEPEKEDLVKSAEAEYLEKGELSEDTYEKLKKDMGLSKQYVDTYIEGVKAKSTQQVSQLAKIAGGYNTLTEATKWAKDNYSAEERADYNEALKSGNSAAMKFAIKQLVNDYNNSKDPVDISKTNDISQKSNVSDVYSLSDLSAKEYDRYLKDPKYKEYINKSIMRNS